MSPAHAAVERSLGSKGFPPGTPKEGGSHHVDEVGRALACPVTRQRMLVWAEKIVGCRDRAEDVVQEAMILAYRRRGTFTGTGVVTSWLYRIVRNECLRQLRLRSATQDPVPNRVDPLPRLEARLVVDELGLRFGHFDGWRELVQVHALGWRIKDVARAQAEPIGTIKSRVSRLRSHLRSHYPTH